MTNTQSGTNVYEIADGIYRINTPVPPSVVPGGFSFNQYLVVDDEPLLFHTGLRKMFPLVQEAVARVLPVARLRYIAFSHVEADECGALNQWLAAAPQAVPLCGRVAAMVADVARGVVGDDTVVAFEPLMVGEDFAYFLQARPGCFFLLGGAPEGPRVGHHTAEFRIDERCLSVGFRVMSAAVLRLLEDG